MRKALPLLRSGIAAALCTSMALSPLAAVASTKTPKSKASAAEIDRAGLIVERLTFGPRPGEVSSVRAMAVDAWLERQLAPERIDDSALEQRLSIYPALQLSQDERLARYPTPATIRQIARTGNLPTDPETRAIVSDQVEFYQMRQDAKKDKADAAPNMPKARAADMPTRNGLAANVSMSGVSGMSSGPMSSTVPAAAAPSQNLEQSTAPMPQPQVDAVLKLAPNERYNQLLRMPPEQLIALRKGLRGNEGKLGDGLTVMQKETLAALAGTNRMISGELFGSRLLRDIYSDRELEAVMTDFWLNHFNVYIRKDGQMPSLLPDYEATVRTHALGRFEDLLEATAKSPAMLMYLDNAQSTGPNSAAAGRPKNPLSRKPNVGLNENYARELMELHTLGVNGGYTQKDVTEVAKVFTGWTMEKPGEGGAFVFNDRRHEPGSKQVLGRTINEAGESEGEEVLHILSTSPATAHFLSLELAERFVSDTPPVALVDRMAQTFLKSQGDMRQVLRAMVHSPEFFAPASVHAKLKTPLEYVASAARATNADVQNPQPLAQSLERLGMPLYGCQPPTGYKWDSETWLSSSALVNRMNFALLLGANKINGSSVDIPRLLDGSAFLSGTAPAANALQGKEQALEAVLLDAPASAQTRNAVLSQTDDSAVQQAMRDFGAAGAQQRTPGAKQHVTTNNRGLGAPPQRPNAPPADKQAAVMLGLLVGSPEFQRR